jgi:hypothetical protein
MSWRIGHWRGSERFQVTIIENANQVEVEGVLRSLAVNQFQPERPVLPEGQMPPLPQVRSNRDGTMLWTTGEIHYTAEWFAKDDSLKRR